MGKILTKEEFEEKIREYYIDHFGELESDIWFDAPAVNVRVFKRDDRFISLQSHILTGEVTEHIE